MKEEELDEALVVSLADPLQRLRSVAHCRSYYADLKHPLHSRIAASGDYVLPYRLGFHELGVEGLDRIAFDSARMEVDRSVA